MSETTFANLYKIDISQYVEKKGGFSYLSWAYAVKVLRESDPKATWEIIRHDGKPFLATECGFFVEVAVTVDGVTLSQIHPVLDNRNKTILKPDAFQINTSIQRALVKAIALHGLGLYIYQGEDIPCVGNDAGGEPSTITAEQVATLNKLIAETSTDKAKFLAFFKTDSLEEMPAGDYKKAITLIEAKKKAAK